MSTQIQWRRGTTAQHNVFTGASGEVTVDTDKYTLVVHDGSTVGGFPLARESQVAAFSANVYTKEESNTSLALKVDKLIGKGLSTEDYSTAEKTKLDGLSNYTKPSAEPISYITDLQTALDAKATTTALNTEKGRIDAILLAADANADTFAEVITLVNSIDTTNDQAFAGYVLSNDARNATIEGNVTNLTSSKADKATTYTKSETDAKIIELAPATDISGKADKATTLTGYGITDAYTKTEINSSLALKVDKVAGKGLSTEDYTSIEKTKLAGIAASANNYSLPIASASVLGGVKAGASISIDANGVISASASGGAVPVGTIITVAKNTAPTEYLKANGALVSRTTYAALFEAIGTTFGVGDGSTTFALPDLRGYFPRGWDDGRGIDTSRVFGSLQNDGYLNHSHTATSASSSHTHTVYATGGTSSPISFARYFTTGSSASNQSPSEGAHTHTITVNASTTGATETRPKNIALLYCIKY